MRRGINLISKASEVGDDMDDPERKRQADALYERHGKPFEAAHNGEYVAISPDGRTILGSSVREVLLRAKEAFGPGNFVFKIGAKAVGKWR
jgi:hypothetical protein